MKRYREGKPSGEMQYNPRGETQLASGDVRVVLGDVNNTWKAREVAGHPGRR